MLETRNLLSAILTRVIYLFCMRTFVCRLLDKPSLGHWFGYPLMLTAIPLVYLLLKVLQLRRPVMYYVQIGPILGFLLVELLVNYSPSGKMDSHKPCHAVLYCNWRDAECC